LILRWLLDEAIQTTTLVIVSTLIALILVFRWELLESTTVDVIRPILDLDANHASLC
jgi:ABC-type proline/glycine betaine transport system permease subunit